MPEANGLLVTWGADLGVWEGQRGNEEGVKGRGGGRLTRPRMPIGPSGIRGGRRQQASLRQHSTRENWYI